MELMMPPPEQKNGRAAQPGEAKRASQTAGIHHEEQKSSVRGRTTYMERIRAKRKARRIRAAVICALLLAGVLAYFTGIYGASLSLLSDVYDSIAIALTPGPGFPTNFEVTGFISAKPFAGGMVAVGDQDIAILSANGNEVRRIRHTYARPSLAVGNSRICVYNRSGTQLVVESRSKTLFQHNTQEPIQLCTMSPNGTLAVFTQGGLTVYDPMFMEIFRFTSAETPTAMTFANDNEQFAVGCLAGEDGALGAVVYLFTTDPNAPEQATAVIQNREGMALRIFYPTNQQVLIVYDTSCALYSAKDGTELARYSYGGLQLQSAELSDGGNDLVLLFGDGTHSSQTSLAVLETEGLTEVGQAMVGQIAKGLAATRTAAYVLTNDGTLCYSLAGELFEEVEVDGKTLALAAASDPLLIVEGQILKLPQPGHRARPPI